MEKMKHFGLLDGLLVSDVARCLECMKVMSWFRYSGENLEFSSSRRFSTHPNHTVMSSLRVHIRFSNINTSYKHTPYTGTLQHSSTPLQAYRYDQHTYRRKPNTPREPWYLLQAIQPASPAIYHAVSIPSPRVPFQAILPSASQGPVYGG